jgi:hypothetical protein
MEIMPQPARQGELPGPLVVLQEPQVVIRVGMVEVEAEVAVAGTVVPVGFQQILLMLVLQEAQEGPVF